MVLYPNYDDGYANLYMRKFRELYAKGKWLINLFF